MAKRASSGAKKVEVRLPKALALNRKQTKHLQDLFQNKVAQVLKDAAAQAQTRLVHPEPKRLVIRAKVKNQVV